MWPLHSAAKLCVHLSSDFLQHQPADFQTCWVVFMYLLQFACIEGQSVCRTDMTFGSLTSLPRHQDITRHALVCVRVADHQRFVRHRILHCNWCMPAVSVAHCQMPANPASRLSTPHIIKQSIIIRSHRNSRIFLEQWTSKPAT